MPVPNNVYVKSVTNITPFSALAILNGAGAGIDEWTVRWSYNSFAFWQEMSLPGSATQAVLSGLTPHTSYLVRIQAHNASGYSFWSEDYSFVTPASVPDPPDPFYIDAQGSTGFHYIAHAPGNNGGAPILEYQTGYGTNPTAPEVIVQTGLDVFVGGLSRSTTYYVWSRARNAAGVSAWSTRYQITTSSEFPGVPVPTFLGDATQTTLHFVFTPGDNGGAAILEYQIGYGGDQYNIQNIISAGPDAVITGLAPANYWFFWARQRNEQGWSAWSNRSVARTVAGARVLDGGVWKEAVPYVNVGGVWKIAQPFIKSVGLWKKSS